MGWKADDYCSQLARSPAGYDRIAIITIIISLGNTIACTATGSSGRRQLSSFTRRVHPFTMVVDLRHDQTGERPSVITAREGERT